MSWPNECWFNVYRSGERGMSHPTRGQCEEAGFPSYMEPEDAGAVYRVHARIKPASTPIPSNKLGSENG